MVEKIDKTLCIIPARGGSKGIKNKNLRKLNGIPLFVHSILQAIDAGIPESHIVVSSDSDVILDIAADYNVNPHQRPSLISTDLSPTELALLNVLENFRWAKTILTLQPTSPIRLQGRISDCLDVYEEGDYDSLLTTTKLYNFFWKKIKTEWEPMYDPKHRRMRQSMNYQDYFYFENGNVYISDTSMLRNTRCRVGRKVCSCPITWVESFQIDSVGDLLLAEKMFASNIHELSISNFGEIE